MNKRNILIGIAIVVSGAIFFIAYHSLARSHASDSAASGESYISKKLPPMTDRVKKMIVKDDAVSIKNIEDALTQKNDPADEEAAYFALGTLYENRNDLLKARDTYKKLIEKYPGSKNIVRAQEALDSVQMRTIFSPVITDNSVLYEVQKGDSLAKIAKKFGTTIDLIKKANNISKNKIRLGSKLKVMKAKFSISVDRSQNILTLKADGEAVKTYNVSTGKNNSTPIGAFTVTTKVINPTWYTEGAVVPPDSPKNILGTRWLGISQKGFGIHGTTEPQFIGQSVTSGCVRMRNEEVEELYTIVPEGTEVVIFD